MRAMHNINLPPDEIEKVEQPLAVPKDDTGTIHDTDVPLVYSQSCKDSTNLMATFISPSIKFPPNVVCDVESNGNIKSQPSSQQLRYYAC